MSPDLTARTLAQLPLSLRSGISPIQRPYSAVPLATTVPRRLLDFPQTPSALRALGAPVHRCWGLSCFSRHCRVSLCFLSNAAIETASSRSIFWRSTTELVTTNNDVLTLVVSFPFRVTKCDTPPAFQSARTYSTDSQDLGIRRCLSICEPPSSARTRTPSTTLWDRPLQVCVCNLTCGEKRHSGQRRPPGRCPP